MSVKKPKQILIIGRPNVGKSTLINRVIRKKKAITLDIPGVTRDLVNFPAVWNNKAFFITDSAGLIFGKSNWSTIQRLHLHQQWELVLIQLCKINWYFPQLAVFQQAIHFW